MDNLDRDWVEFFNRIGTIQGIDNLCSSIFAILYIEPDEVAMDDIAKKTGYSLASISNKIKAMEQMGLVRRKCHPGTRKIYLTVEKDLTKFIKDIFIKKELVQIKMVKECVPCIIEKYKSKAMSDVKKKKIALMRGYYDHNLRYEEIIQKMLNLINEK